MSTPSPISGNASLSDLLTATKNIVTALSTAAQNYMSVQGISNLCAITVPTVVKSTAGRIGSVSVIIAGSAQGMIYDSAQVGTITKPLCPIPNIVGVYTANLPANVGVLVVPGTGQTVSVSFS
jgi:hypothetical protein